MREHATISELERLIEIASSSSWDEIHIKYRDIEIRLSSGILVQNADDSKALTLTPPKAPPPDTGTDTETHASQKSLAKKANRDTSDEKPRPGVTSNHDWISSPSTGTYWAAPSPSDPPFVQVGDHVEIGQTLCIIEIMKLMSEVQADRAGVVLDINPKNGDLVEYGAPLFLIGSN